MKAKSFLTLFLFLCLIVLGIGNQAYSQVTINLVYSEKNNLTTIQSGAKYCMQVDYAISSTTGSATGVKAVINLPDWIHSVSDFVGTVHAPVGNFVFSNTPGSKKLTINFVSPLSSGSTGVLEFCARVNNLTTPNNTNVCSTAEITDGSGNTSGVKNFCINSTAVPRICAEKTLLNGGAIGYNTTYRIRIFYEGIYGTIPFGTLEAENIVLTDVLPAGATFVSAVVFNGATQVGTGTESGGTVTANVPDLSFYNFGFNWQANTYHVDITVKFDNPPFSAGNSVTNTATVAYTPFGGTPSTLSNGDNVGGTCVTDLIETTTLTSPTISATLARSGGGNVFPGQSFGYDFGFNNTGNVPLENLEIIETIPGNVYIDQTAPYRGVRFDNQGMLDHVEYQTNLNASWTSYPITGGQVVPFLPSGEYFTKIKFVMKTPWPANTSLGLYHLMYFVPRNDVMADETVSNCLVWESTTPGIPALAARTTCNNNYILKPRPTTGALDIVASTTPCNDVLKPVGTPIVFKGEVTANAGYADVTNPVAGYFVPSGFIYTPGSQTFNPLTSGLPTPTFEILPNYQTISGKSYDLYRWKFPTGSVLPFGKKFEVSIATTVGPALLPNTGYVGIFTAFGSNVSLVSSPNNFGFTDTNDWNQNGNTTESVTTYGSNYSCYSIIIPASASMESIKWVRGQLDAGYSRYPAFGQTVHGGMADYRLVVKNTGNVPMKDIEIVDILPFVGDMGVIDPSPRNTAWRPNLANPIIAPAGVTVYYSTAQNPCRDEMKAPADPSPFPTGCTPANWTLAPLPDITSVQSLKFDFGNIIINPLDSFILNWPMRAPVDAPSNGEIAWNSFGFRATRTDNNQSLLPAEPIKVGIQVTPAIPGIYGDYVWIDTNKNGIQDEIGTGVSGVVVELYRDNGDGISNPLTDVLVGFTVTDLNGRYLFPNLIPSDYYAVFYPPAGYVVTSTDQGGDDTKDSDGIIMPVTRIDAAEDDRTWDLGLYLSPDCDVNISYVSVSPCHWNGTSSEVVVNAYVTWANAPAGQNINVTLNGVTQVIDVVGGAQQMAFVTFTIPANNTVFTINACFTGGSNCCDQRSLKPKLPCNPNQCYLDITNVYAGSCDGTNFVLDVEVNWSVPPAGENIIVTAGGQTQTINVSGGILPPVCAVFTLPANGSMNNTVTASFQTTTSCNDSGMYNAPTCNVCNLTVTCAPLPQTTCTPVNGSASVNVMGGQGTITYLWSSGETISSISGKAAGTYTVTVTDDFLPNCSKTCQAVITSTTTNPSVTCGKTDNSNCATPNGTATATATGVTYLWSNNATTASITGLSANTYTVTVTNTTTGCTATCSAVVVNATVNPTCNITANTHPSCPNLTGGDITVVPSPAGTYTYAWSDNGAATANRTGLTGGTYTVTVTNTTTNCTGVCNVTLDTPTNCCNIQAIVPQNLECLDNGTPALITDNRIRFNAQITNSNTSLTGYNVTINGGTTITPNTNVPYGVTQFILGTGTAGGGSTFTVTVTDSATPGCTRTFQIGDPGNCTPGNPPVECPTPKCGTATIQINNN
ncbi:MAG: hypothetical protein IPK35_16750 [Saprospiraceae bacterium]|nr:hypothetical protein [Saprospiraceae bacterium]